MKRYFGNLSFYQQALMIGIPVMLQSLIQSLVSLYMPCWVYTNVQFSVARAGGDTVMGAVVDGCVTLEQTV